MKSILPLFLVVLLFISCKQSTKEPKEISVTTKAPEVTTVASFSGQQVTGVTVTTTGRIFVNFPRWRKGVINSVLELGKKTKEPFPNKEWNSWEIGDKVEAHKFVGVQSVVAFEDKLYVLDTRSPLFQEVVDAPRIFVFDLTTKALEHTYILTENAYHANSYINDLRVDKKNNKIYFTDSGNSGLVILDLKTETFDRVLDEHSSTAAEQGYLTFTDGKWMNTVHSDGIALDTKNDKLYYHALTGYSLYSIPTKALLSEDELDLEKAVTLEAKTSAPDGMIFDKNGNLYYADLENNKIMYREPNGSVHSLLEGDKVRWADTFSIYDNHLYYTNSRINEVTADISEMEFTVNRVYLPEK
ncbi:SMP-30/gluconolactonase/LRE family protein [Cellulophaga sp. HaHa_2_95]|uniref:L-dopachrome tautomerase-related protein n=1 Tax=Cellulophaga sp. HaHa_2_95 TaxID=2745558 RepID=UPI001C4FC858|nr:L-dopachrome tautomerase-related protein [Cellulophaga sp. HaHa_2_95]QXP55649.1 SMP-30/gluconolactonase/LRE family protein [Cellulophaga sp. HaHa_2_95]